MYLGTEYKYFVKKLQILSILTLVLEYKINNALKNINTDC